MHKKLMMSIIFTIFTTAATTSISATKELEDKIYSIIPLYGTQGHVPRQTRLEYALAIREYFLDFDNRVPKLSPKENDWLVEELKASDDRLRRAVSSREYGFWILNLRISECIEAIDRLIEFSESYQTVPEMFQWLNVQRCYYRKDEIIDSLNKAGIKNSRWEGPYFASISSMILDTITIFVIPSAMRSAVGIAQDD